MHRRILSFSFVLLLALVVVAQTPDVARIPSVDRLRAHIEFLASDKLEGRRTGSTGATTAAAYIAREFSRYGLRRSIGWDTPGMSVLEADSPNRYLQEFPYIAGVDLGKNNALTLTKTSGSAGETQGSFKTTGSETFRLREDWMPLGLSSNGTVEGEAVFAGYGITDSELTYNDYQSAHASGKIAIVFAGTPDGDNPHGRFAKYEDVRWKAIAARNAMAKALVIISRDDNLKDDRLATLEYDHGGGDSGLPVIVISRQIAAKIFDLKDFEDFAQKAQATLAHQGSDRVGGNSVTITASFDVLRGVTLKLSTDIVRHEVEAANVVGILDGSDPVLKKEVIVIGAHYDHLGHGGEGSLAPREGEIHHGADDNASGVAGMLELARIFAGQYPRPKRTLVFMAFGGEEEGLLGSNYYVNHPIVPLAETVAMINMDMIGRMKDNKLIVGGMGTATEWRDLVASINRSPLPAVIASGTNNSHGAAAVVSVDAHTPTADNKERFTLTLSEDGYGPSDHSSFYSKQIPVLFFWTGTHEDYHKPSDTADKINYVDEARIVSMVEQLAENIAAADKRPSYTVAKSDSTGRSMGFRVYLGTIPNYADSDDGLTLDGVRDDSPAAKAGLKAGDKIVKLAGREVRNVYDYTYALGEMKAGQEYEVELIRGGQRMTLKITPAARK